MKATYVRGFILSWITLFPCLYNIPQALEVKERFFASFLAKFLASTNPHSFPAFLLSWHCRILGTLSKVLTSSFLMEISALPNGCTAYNEGLGLGSQDASVGKDRGPLATPSHFLAAICLLESDVYLGFLSATGIHTQPGGQSWSRW